MKQPPRQRPYKDERDEQIETHSRSAALDSVVAATQILTIMCLIKGNPAWKGSLALLFIGGAVSLFINMISMRKSHISRLVYVWGLLV